MFKSKTTWNMESEHNMAYFYGLEKTKYGARVMSSLVTDGGTVVCNLGKIFKMQKQYYKKLYTYCSKVKFSKPNNVAVPAISFVESLIMEQEFKVD